jgi:hypothetical protein
MNEENNPESTCINNTILTYLRYGWIAITALFLAVIFIIVQILNINENTNKIATELKLQSTTQCTYPCTRDVVSGHCNCPTSVLKNSKQ